TYWIGVTLLMLAVLEGYMGYSLLDDLLSGMGLAIGWGVAMSLPIIGGPLATWLWAGEFPGTSAFESRLYIAHVFIVPIIIATLVAVHLLLVMLLHHTQFEGRGRREANVVGSPLWPSYTFRSLGLFAVVTGGLFALGGLVQINPIWLYGPYHPYIGTSGAQPDWYLGWLIGALRMMPNWEPTIGGYTIVPNPFWGGALFPLLIFGLLYAWPLIDRLFTRDRAAHNLLQRPRDTPVRTAFGVGIFTFAAVPFFAGSMDRVYIQFGIPYEGAVRVMQVLWIVLPIVAGLIALAVCRNLRGSHLRPLRGVTAHMVGRADDGGLVAGASLMANPSWQPDPAPLPVTERSARGIGELVEDAAAESAALARLEVNRAVSELVARAQKSAAAAAGIGAALFLAGVAATALVTAVVLALGLIMPLWLAGLITAVVLLLAAALLVWLGARRRRANRTPD
ncbi:MAG: cytochrome b N-terminal domain-containing protein, partial [Gaiellales bacterium]